MRGGENGWLAFLGLALLAALLTLDCHDRHGVDEDGGDDDEIGSIGKNDDCFSDALASLALMIVSDSQTHFPKY